MTDTKINESNSESPFVVVPETLAPQVPDRGHSQSYLAQETTGTPTPFALKDSTAIPDQNTYCLALSHLEILHILRNGFSLQNQVVQKYEYRFNRVAHPMKNQGFSYPFLDNPKGFYTPF